MSIAQTLLPEFDHEMANTRRMLELVPAADADVAHTLAEITRGRAPRAKVPYSVALAYAAVAQAWAGLTGGETLVTTAGVRLMNARLQVTSALAERELGWRARPLGETLRDEVAWFREQGMTTDRVPGRAEAA